MLVSWLVLAVGVFLATKIVGGITCDSLPTLVAVVLLLGFLNAILRPVLLLFTLPFIVLTLGLGVVVINALLFLIAGNLVAGFHVHGFWPAVGGALVVSVTNLVLGRTLRRPAPPAVPPVHAARRDDTIDI